MFPTVISALLYAGAFALPMLGKPSRALLALPFFAVLLVAFAVATGPTLAYDSPGFLVLVLTSITLGTVIAGNGLVMLSTIVLSLVGLLVIAITTLPIFNASSYRNLLDVELVEYDGSTELLAQDRVQLVDDNRARIRASEVLGARQGLGSQYGFGEFNLQIVDGRPTWVAPLVNNRTVAWFMGSPTPGYVTVDATDARNVAMVTDWPIAVHGPGDSWLGSIDRHLWLGDYADVHYTDHSFEIDEEGRPHWVTSAFEREVGIGGVVVSGSIVTDATSSAASSFDVAGTPEWVDRIQPADFVEARVRTWGDYVHGWLNSQFAGRDVITPTTDVGMSVVHMADGSTKWYTGMRTAGSTAGGTSGFTLVDARTGMATVYTTAGISEATAQEVVRGAYQAEGYGATNPRLYLVEGRPTLVSLVTDEGGNVRGVGMVAQETRAVYGVGRDLEEARRAYVGSWRRNAAGSIAPGSSEVVVAEFEVARIGFETVEGFTNAILVDRDMSRFYTVPVREWRDVVLVAPGDVVRIGHPASGERDVVATSFAIHEWTPSPLEAGAPDLSPSANERPANPTP